MTDELIERVRRVIAASKRIPEETVTLDSAFDQNQVADVERSIDPDCDPGKQVAKCILQSEPQNDRNDAGSRH